MSIVVAYKWAANPSDAPVAADGTVDWSRTKATISDYDPVAIELGRQLADAAGTELVGVSVGGPAAADSLARKATLSRGLDRLVLVADPAFDGADALLTGRAIAALAARVGDVQLVLTGDASVDVGAHLVPATVAGTLGWPCLADVQAVEGTPGDLTVRQLAGVGLRTVKVPGPAVLALTSDAALPRIPGMKDVLAAGKKPVEVLSLAEAGVEAESATTVSATRRLDPPPREGRLIPGADPAAAAAELAQAIKTMLGA